MFPHSCRNLVRLHSTASLNLATVTLKYISIRISQPRQWLQIPFLLATKECGGYTQIYPWMTILSLHHWATIPNWYSNIISDSRAQKYN